MPDFVVGPGFKSEAASRSWNIVSDEAYFEETPNGKVSFVMCEEGVMFYESVTNKIVVLPKG